MYVGHAGDHAHPHLQWETWSTAPVPPPYSVDRERFEDALAQAIATAGRHTGPYGQGSSAPRRVNPGHRAKAREIAAELIREGVIT